MAARPALTLFAPDHPLIPIVEGVLLGRLGRATVAADGRAARLTAGCYEIFGGDAGAKDARRLATGIDRHCELVYGNDPRWRALLRELYGGRVADRPMDSFEPRHADAAALRRMAEVPAPYRMVPLDASLCARLDHELEPHALQAYADAAEFLASGFGYAVVHGDEVACAATTYGTGSRHAEVAIATRPAHRGRGLARAASARLMLHGLDVGLESRWNASNPVSKRLAARLGFVPVSVSEVLYLA